MEEPPSFIADEMNGRLARWLRILGFDCIYISGENADSNILKLALETGRIVLTSDKELYRKIIRRGGYAILTPGDTLENKFRYIKNEIDIKKWIGKLPHRCSICNSILVKVPSNMIPDLPPSVKERFTHVWHCNNCGKTYWEGSHWANIKKQIKRLLT